MNRRTNCLIGSAAIVFCAPFGNWSFADAANSEVRSLAATCAACHGTDGHAVGESAALGLAGLPKADFVRQMRAFREGTAQAVMQQVAKGYSDEQISALGDFFAAQR